MMRLSISLHIIASFLVVQNSGYNSFFGWLEGGTQNVATAAFSLSNVETACMALCLPLLQTFLELSQIQFYVIAGYNCYCSNSLGRNADGQTSYKYVKIWRPPINSLSNELTIGTETEQAVLLTIREYVGGNDKFKFYLTTDMNNITNSGLLNLLRTVKTPTSTMTHGVGMTTYEIDDKTKRGSIFVERYPSSLTSNTINPHIYAYFKISDVGVENGTTAWFTSIFQNDKMVVVDLKNYTIIRPATLNCEANYRSTSSSVEGEQHITYEMEPLTPCSASIEDITIRLTLQHNIYVSSVDSKKECIDPTEIKNSPSEVIIKFRRLYTFSKMCATIKLRGNLSSKGLAPAVVRSDVKYTEYVNGLSQIKREEKYLSLQISNERRGFSIFNKDTGNCIINDKGAANLALKPCEQFIVDQHNLKTTSGQCLDMEETTKLIKLVDCKIKKKRLSISQLDIKFKHETNYYYSGSTSATTASTVPTNLYQRVYESPFGISGNKEDSKETQSFESNHVTIMLVENDFIVCGPPSLKNGRCIEYSTIDSKVKVLPSIMTGVLGYHPKRDFVYGIDKDGRSIVYKRDKYNEILRVSDNHLQKAYSQQEILLSTNFSMKTLYEEIQENVFSIGNNLYSVSSIGLLDSASRYPIVIFAPEKDCADNIGKTQAAALPSCKEIKSYCKSVKSGLFWIGGILMTTFKQVYCDMQSRYGGWTMVANYTVIDGNPLEISGNFTEDLHDVATSNFTRYLSSPTGLKAAQDYMGFHKIRFFCQADRSSRTMHLETSGTYGDSPVLWCTQSMAYSPTSCSSFNLYPDDSSNIVSQCSNWGQTSGGGVGYWGSHDARTAKIYDRAIKTSDSAFDFKSTATLRCDDMVSGTIKNGVWQIFVR